MDIEEQTCEKYFSKTRTEKELGIYTLELIVKMS
jgi:hypothetical protein